MLWNYCEKTGDHITGVIKELEAAINNISSTGYLSARIGGTAKIVTSDQNNGDARGVVFYWTKDPGEPYQIPLVPLAGSVWAVKTFTTDHNYTRLYTDATALLTGMDMALAINAHATMTNYRDGDATLSVWYPTQN